VVKEEKARFTFACLTQKEEWIVFRKSKMKRKGERSPFL